MLLQGTFTAAITSLIALADMATTTSVGPRDEGKPRLKNWGVVLFRAFDGQDVFGPVDALQLLSYSRQTNLYLIADTMDPVTSQPAAAAAAAATSTNSSFWTTVLPTHTFADAPELDVLLVPGGGGVRAPDADVKSITGFIAGRYPSLEYLVTICTGAGLAARSGVLDGRRATTNKSAWSDVMYRVGQNVAWARQARWVVDGNIWTSAGVTAGLDLTFAFMAQFFGYELSHRIATVMEYIPTTNSSNDPFGAAMDATGP